MNPGLSSIIGFGTWLAGVVSWIGSPDQPGGFTVGDVAGPVGQALSYSIGTFLHSILSAFSVVLYGLFLTFSENGESFISQTPAHMTYANQGVLLIHEVMQMMGFGLLVIAIAWGGLGLMMRQFTGAPYPDLSTLLGKTFVAALGITFSLAMVRWMIDLNDEVICTITDFVGLVVPSTDLSCNHITPPGWGLAVQAPGEFSDLPRVGFAFTWLILALALVVLMLMRIATIDILLVLSPIAFALWVLPQTEVWAQRWWNLMPMTIFQQAVQMLVLILGVVIVSDFPAGSSLNDILQLLIGLSMLMLTLKVPGLLNGQALQAGTMEVLSMMSSVGAVGRAGATGVRATHQVGGAGLAAGAGALGGARGYRAAQAAGTVGRGLTPQAPSARAINLPQVSAGGAAAAPSVRAISLPQVSAGGAAAAPSVRAISLPQVSAGGAAAAPASSAGFSDPGTPPPAAAPKSSAGFLYDDPPPPPLAEIQASRDAVIAHDVHGEGFIPGTQRVAGPAGDLGAGYGSSYQGRLGVLGATMGGAMAGIRGGRPGTRRNTQRALHERERTAMLLGRPPPAGPTRAGAPDRAPGTVEGEREATRRARTAVGSALFFNSLPPPQQAEVVGRLRKEAAARGHGLRLGARERDFLVNMAVSEDPRDRWRGIEYSREHSGGRSSLMAESLASEGVLPATISDVQDAGVDAWVWNDVRHEVAQARAFDAAGRQQRADARDQELVTPTPADRERTERVRATDTRSAQEQRAAARNARRPPAPAAPDTRPAQERRVATRNARVALRNARAAQARKPIAERARAAAAPAAAAPAPDTRPAQERRVATRNARVALRNARAAAAPAAAAPAPDTRPAQERRVATRNARVALRNARAAAAPAAAAPAPDTRPAQERRVATRNARVALRNARAAQARKPIAERADRGHSPRAVR